MILSDVLTCTVSPLRVESSLLKNPIPPNLHCVRAMWRHPRRCLELPRTVVGRGWARHAASDCAAPTSQAHVGDSYDTIRCFTAAEVGQFASLTHDSNPMHTDPDFAAKGRFGACVVHGMLVGSLFGAIVGQRFPGAIYLSQSLEFRKPVFVGETVRATIQVQGVRASGRMLDFETQCTNQKGELVVTGGARCLLPRGSPLAASREAGAEG
jgi:acyl dehydratase